MWSNDCEVVLLLLQAKKQQNIDALMPKTRTSHAIDIGDVGLWESPHAVSSGALLMLSESNIAWLDPLLLSRKVDTCTSVVPILFSPRCNG